MEKVEQTEQKDSSTCTQTNPRSSKLAMLKRRFKIPVTKVETKNLPCSLKLKGWQMLSTSSKRNYCNSLATFFREHLFQLLGTLSLIICAFLFTFQAYLAFRSFQMMNQLQKKPQIPEMLYRLYFEGNDWALNLDRVDLRANTTIFVH